MNNGTLTGRTKQDGVVAQVGDVKDVVVEIKDKIIDVKDKVLGVKDTMISKGGDTAERIKNFTMEHPLKAIALAFAVGYIGMRITRPLRFL